MESERPTDMLSKIKETESGLIITSPKRKSWVIIVLLSFLHLQSGNGVIQTLFSKHYELSIEGKVAILFFSCMILYFSLRELLWQLKGMKEISFSDKELYFRKMSPLFNQTKKYNLADIKSVEVKDESVSEGPLAMLQLLGIKDKIKLNIIHGYKTITTISGVDKSEAVELKEIIDKKLSSNTISN